MAKGVRMRLTSRVGMALAIAIMLTACTSDAEPDESGPQPRPSAPATATQVPTPTSGRCYTYDFDAALSPTNDASSLACGRPHTAETYAVGRVSNTVDGHLLAVDSARVQAQVAEVCPAKLFEFVGGGQEAFRLSTLRAVWFTPTIEESDIGADWYRCDVVAVGGDNRLVELTSSLENVLSTPAGRTRFGICGTAAPGSRDFTRVPCSQPHTWRAISIVELPDGPYPGVRVVRARGQEPCEDAGAAVADDPLDYRWAYTPPDADQWAAGQTFGRCWAPD